MFHILRESEKIIFKENKSDAVLYKANNSTAVYRGVHEKGLLSKENKSDAVLYKANNSAAEKGFLSIHSLSINSNVHNQLMRTLFEARTV